MSYCEVTVYMHSCMYVHYTLSLSSYALFIPRMSDAVISAIFTLLEARNVAHNAVTEFPIDGIPNDHMSDWFKILVFIAQVLYMYIHLHSVCVLLTSTYISVSQ